MTQASAQAAARGEESFVSPAGVSLSGPPGLLQFLVGIQDNESTWDYFRAQGSPVGSIEPPSASQGGGYGAYQFQVGTDQFNEANAANWDPATQDRIAASMATGYFNEFGGLAQQMGVNPWELVAEAWYGPGTVPQEPIAANSQADVDNVLNAEGGHAALPAAWQFGSYKGGLSSAEVAKELGGQPVPATGGGPVPNTGGGTTGTTPATLLDDPLGIETAVKDLLGGLYKIGFIGLGAAMIVVGGYLAAGKKLPNPVNIVAPSNPSGGAKQGAAAELPEAAVAA